MTTRTDQFHQFQPVAFPFSITHRNQVNELAKNSLVRLLAGVIFILRHGMEKPLYRWRGIYRRGHSPPMFVQLLWEPPAAADAGKTKRWRWENCCAIGRKSAADSCIRATVLSASRRRPSSSEKRSSTWNSLEVARERFDAEREKFRWVDEVVISRSFWIAATRGGRKGNARLTSVRLTAGKRARRLQAMELALE